MKTQFLDFLDLLDGGKVSVDIKGMPLLEIDSASKSLELEVSGLRASVLKVSDLLKESTKSRRLSLIFTSEEIASTLSRKGWKLVLYDKGEKILSMGRGVSRLTGRISFNPLKLRKILQEV